MRPMFGCAVVVGLVGVVGVVAPVTAAAGPLMCHGVAATIVGTRGDDLLLGTDGNDVIVGLAGNDQVQDNGGDDLVCGNTGDDAIFTGAGDDKVWSGSGDDQVWFGEGRDIVRTGDGADRVKVWREAQLDRTPELWTGSGDDDVRMPGWSPGGLVLHAGGGADYVMAWADTDSHVDLDGGVGDDHLDLYLWKDRSDLDVGAQVTFDLRSRTWTGTSTRSGGIFRQWEQPEIGGSDNNHFTYHGNNSQNWVLVFFGSVSAYMYGGDDYVVTNDGGNFVDGGNGTDAVSLLPPSTCISVEIDLGYNCASPELGG